MTTDTIKLLARYNFHVNAEMRRVLGQLADGEWNRVLGGYYPSIRSICSHLFIVDFAWLRRFANLRPFTYAQHPILQGNPTWGGMLFPSFLDYDADRKALDECLTKFAEEVTAEDLPKRLRYKDFKGIDQEREVAKLILHMFNHQTHHRGMISLYLDLLGKENDFSALLALVD
ncbi:MAG TPA: DinB family protein [Polyangia bacterium]|jgi:uncharacterized damage-inducible protein DinB